ncbi:RNA recognition motif domain-containing protein [Dioscorea alata]|uniref:RNA recognition motif domain-containing protein n=1 Tax=Dioscorea alata TaxID=55571 RepID=A0ACB7V8N4_DIOAL|nr:RNA recognition motif domain-containing protein [Dioscorea alata]
MAATAAISSCFSATITANLHLKHTSSFNNLLKLFSSSSSSLRPSSSLTTSPNLWKLSHCPRIPRISCIVAQEQTVGEQDQLVVEQESTIPLPPSSQSTKLYFGNLPYNCDSAQLAGIIQQFADPEMVEVLYDRDTGKSRGFAFVTMSCIEDCEAVIKNLDRTVRNTEHLFIYLHLITLIELKCSLYVCEFISNLEGGQ